MIETIGNITSCTNKSVKISSPIIQGFYTVCGVCITSLRKIAHFFKDMFYNLGVSPVDAALFEMHVKIYNLQHNCTALESQFKTLQTPGQRLAKDSKIMIAVALEEAFPFIQALKPIVEAFQGHSSIVKLLFPTC
jgi:hypothetical protein